MVFFSTVVSVLDYLGVMDVVIRAIGMVMQALMGTTAVESFGAPANIFFAPVMVPNIYAMGDQLVFLLTIITVTNINAIQTVIRSLFKQSNNNLHKPPVPGTQSVHIVTTTPQTVARAR